MATTAKIEASFRAMIRATEELHNRRTATYELKFSSDEKGVTLKVVVLADQGSQWLSLRQLQKHHPDLSIGLGLLASAVLFILVACLLARFLMWMT